MQDHDTNQFLPTLSEKGQYLYNLAVRAREMHRHVAPACLCSGSVLSTKTWSVATLVMRHLWETPGARFVIFSTRVKTLSDAGPWKIFYKKILPEWCHPETGIGMKILSQTRDGIFGPIVNSTTRTILLRVSNYYGGMSEIQLNSIQNEGEIDDKLLSTSYSGIWFSELKLWKSPNLFKVSRNRLRMDHIEPWQHLWIADTNPPKEATKSWIYPLWFKAGEKQIPDHLASRVTPEILDEVRRSMHLIEWTMDDNPFMSDEAKQAKLLELSDDPYVYQRDGLGLWVSGGEGSNFLFTSVFKKHEHVIGIKDSEYPHRGAIKLAAGSDHLYSGWDLGGGANHAAGIIEKRLVLSPTGPISVFSVIASVSRTDEHVLIQDFTKLFMTEREKIAKRYPDRKISMTHYSDDSAVNQPRASGAGFDYLEVMIASRSDTDPESQIVLVGVPKPNKSVGARIRLLRRLIREGRFYVSANCEDVIAMLEEATSSATEEIEWSEHKHVFDWISYVLWMLCGDELEEMSQGPKAEGDSTTIAVPL